MKKNNRKIVYFDNAATTKLCDNALSSMIPYLNAHYGNPSSIYDFGKTNRKVIEDCRSKIAKHIGASANEIIFTSGGTESNNTALKGIYYNKFFKSKKYKFNIVTSEIEHKSILNTCNFLLKNGVEIRYVKNDRNGIVDLDDLDNKIDNNTLVCSIMFVNNEIGIIEPIKKIAGICKKHNVLFHTDAVQALGHIKINVKNLGVDLLSVSAHKFNGPKGIGFLYKNNSADIESMENGGGQEFGLRSGTENVASIVGMTEALDFNLTNLAKHIEYVKELKHYLIMKLENFRKIKKYDFIYNCDIKKSLYSHLSVSFKNLYAENIIHILNLNKICISSGSSCNSRVNVISYVLSAIKCPTEYINGTIRITLSYCNTKEEIDYFVFRLDKALSILYK